MDNIIQLFDGSPRLSNNILPKTRRSPATVTNLENAISKRKIEKLIVQSGNLSFTALNAINLIKSAAQIDPNLLKRIRDINNGTFN